jgi:alpha-tubulin suppressor-like RCC1 family protein
LLGGLVAACGEEFPDEPAKPASLVPAGWPSEVFVTDVDTIAVDASLAGSGTPITGLRLTWQSNDDATLHLEPLRPLPGASRADTLAAQLRAAVTGKAGGFDSVLVIIEAGGALEPDTLRSEIHVVQKWASVSAGEEHSCGVTVEGVAFCWGEVGFSPDGGFLGNGSSFGSTIPVEVIGGLTFTSVDAGDRHTCGTLADRRVFCWGLNSFGAAGSGAGFGVDQLAPVPVALGRTFSSVSAGAGYACGVTTDDAGYCWGLDQAGQLGDGQFDEVLDKPQPPFDNCTIFDSPIVRCSLTPRSVRTRTGVPLDLTAIGAGTVHTCGVRSDGEAVCWGSGSVEIGQASAVQTDTARVVPGGVQFSAITAGASHTCALAFDATAYCWGFDSHGQLGAAPSIGSCTLFSGHEVPCTRTPVPVSGGLTLQSLSAGGNTTCGIGTDSTAYCWGSNQFGQLGTGSAGGQCEVDLAVIVSCSRTPVKITVPGDPKFLSVSAGGRHACGVTVAGMAWCWGAGSGGKLGNGSEADSPTPVRVAEPE